MLNWIVRNRTDYLYKLDLALNNQQRLIYHKTQTTKEIFILTLNHFDDHRQLGNYNTFCIHFCLFTFYAIVYRRAQFISFLYLLLGYMIVVFLFAIKFIFIAVTDFCNDSLSALCMYSIFYSRMRFLLYILSPMLILIVDLPPNFWFNWFDL